MRMGEEWLKTWICLSFLLAQSRAARPRFDVSTDMGMVLVPADAEVETAIFRLRATDQDTDFPLIFEIIATTSPIVRVENLPCTLYNKVCQANVILTRRLVAGRLHDFVVRVRDSKGDVNSMQATISVTNSTTPRDKIFPHLPSLIMVPENTKPEKELDYLLVESNPWSGKPVYIELWQPKELFKIRQRQIGSQTKGVITLIGDLDFETQSMYTLTMYATDPYTERGKDTRNLAGLHVVVIVQDVQDVPPVFTLAPPLTKINNSIKPGDLVLRVHAEDGDKGVPRDVTYGLISEDNPFTPFFNVSETTGEIRLVKPLEDLTKIVHVGAPIVLKVVAEEIRSMRDEPPAQATVVELGLLLGEPGNTPPYFENNNYVAWIDENAEPGTIIVFTDDYSTRVKDEDIGKAGVFALKLENNNGTFEINPTVAERKANFVITVRDNALIDYEKFRNLQCMIIAQEVGPATNLSTSVPLTIFLRDINDNYPIFDNAIYNVTLAENINAGTKVIQVHATDNDAGLFGKIQYTKIIGDGGETFTMNPDNGIITVSMGSVLDREQTPKLELTVEARDEDGRGLRGTASLIVNILDVNDNSPVFEREIYEFLLNADLTNFTTPVFLKAGDADVEPPNNLVRYEIVHGNYENKFHINEETGELVVREAINRSRKIRQSNSGNQILNMRKQFRRQINDESLDKQNSAIEIKNSTLDLHFHEFHPLTNSTRGGDLDLQSQNRSRRAQINPLFILTVRAYDLGVPHLSDTADVRVMPPASAFARIVMFVMPGENPDPTKTAETLATITGSRVTIQEIKPYVAQINPESGSDIGKRSVVVARVEQNGPGTLVDVDKIRASLTANGFGIISGMDNASDNIPGSETDDNTGTSHTGRSSSKNVSAIDSKAEDVTGYKVENKLLTWMLVLLGLLLLAAVITLIICCICPSCPFYMEPRKRRVHSSETLVIHSGGRPKRHLHRKPIKATQGDYYIERKEAWSADPGRQQWQFNRRNTKHLGIASLPGDIVPRRHNPDVERLRRVASLRLRDEENGDPGFGDQVLFRSRLTNLAPPNERMYMEDVDMQSRNFDGTELDSLRKQELERGSDGMLGNEQVLPVHERFREQHFYRDGNAEILKLITRGDIDDHKLLLNAKKELNHGNAKEILLQRFIEDQKLRQSQNLRDSFQESFHEADINHSMESHQRPNEITEILILPEKLDLQHQPYNSRLHQQEQMLNADVQRLIVERNYKSKDFKDDEGDEYRGRGILKAAMRDAEMATEEVAKGSESTSYELVRQNALLTRLLLEKEVRGLNVPIVDSSSFLETQSLPGHVAIATQTDRTTATQTEFFGRSRSDNEDLEEDQRIRRKSKLKERFETKEDFRKLKTIWVRTPIIEESRTWSGNKISTPTRTKIEVTESCKVSISPDVLKEISSSLKSSESGCIEEDEDQEVLARQAKNKLDIMQKTHQLHPKVACTSMKKMREEKADNGSTTGSPEVKKKNSLMKSKIRKKADKSLEVKKLEKNTKSERSRFMEPSFRVLEREFSSIHKKIRDFSDKKLKIIKRDNEKMEKKSKNSDENMYDVSKKYENTVKKRMNSTSTETSPTKITVEEKIKTGEEESGTRDEQIENQQKPSNSSSEVEDNDKSNKQILNLTEKVITCSKIQTRGRSKLRRQPHLQNFDRNSESERIERSEDSESRINKLKGSTSSLEMKIDSTSYSSRDFGKKQKQTENKKIQKPQTQEKKCMRSKKLTTKLRPTGIVDIKRKVHSLEAKSIEDSKKKIVKRDEKLDINKTSTSDDSKSISLLKTKETAYHIHSTTSEEEKSNQETKSSMTKRSTAFDLDKLVKEVKDAVGKEISSFTQAAKDALNIKKSSESETEIREKKLKTPLKLKEAHKIESTIDKKAQETHILQSVGKEEKISKLIERKDSKKRVKNLENKSKLAQNTSPIKLKSDNEIPFVLIDNNKTISNMDKSLNNVENKKNDALVEKFKNSKQLQENSDQSNEKIESKENLIENENETKILNNISQELPEEMVNNVVDVAKKIMSDKIDKSDKTILTDNTKKINVISEETQSFQQNLLDNIEQPMKTVMNKTDDIKEMIVDGKNQDVEIIPNLNVKTKINIIDETEKLVPIESKEIKKDLTDIINETEEIFFNKIDNNEQIISNANNEIKGLKTDEINDTEKRIDDEVEKTKKSIVDVIDDTEKISNQNTEVNRILSDKIDDMENNVTDKVDETENLLLNENDVTKRNIIENVISDTVDELKEIVSDKIPKAESILRDETDKLEENISNTITKTETSVSNKTDEIKEVCKEINDTKQNVLENMDENYKVILNKTEEGDVKLEEEITKNNTNEVSETNFEIEEESDTISTSKMNDITEKNLNDSANHESNETMQIEQNDTQEIENTNLKESLKSESTCLSDKLKDSIIEQCDVNSIEINSYNESDTNTSKENSDNIDTKIIEKEEPCEKKLISVLNGSFKEKEIIEVAQIKQAMEDKIDEESRSNGEYNAQKNLNPDEEPSLSKMTDIKETGEPSIRLKQETDEKKLISLNDSDGDQENNRKSSPLTQHSEAPEIFINDENKETFISEIKEIKEIVNSSSTENKEENNSIKDFSDQFNNSKKTMIELPNAISLIKADDESDNDSSTDTDISNKTALRTKPYRTPRHSISSDEIEDTSAPKLGKTRQKWNPEKEKDSVLQVPVEQSKEPSIIGSPQKIEMMPPDKIKNSKNKAMSDQTKMKKSPAREIRETSFLSKPVENTDLKMLNSKQRKVSLRARPVIVGIKKKDQLGKTIPNGEKSCRLEDTKPQRPNPWENRSKISNEQRKHSKPHVSPRTWQPKEDSGPVEGRCARRFSKTPSPMQESKGERSSRPIDHGKDPEIANARSRYMAWYQQKRIEMERKRRERKESEEEQTRPRWLKPRTCAKSRKAKSAEHLDQRQDATKKVTKVRRSKERAKSSSDVAGCQSVTSSLGRFSISQTRLRIRPLVNVESEQLKAIVRQGRRLRKAEGAKEDPEVLIFVPEKPPQPRGDGLPSVIQLEPRHHLTQHSEYKYEKDVPPIPFFLHPPPMTHSLTESILQDAAPENQRLEDDLDPGLAVSMHGGTRLRHQQLLEKKSVFDIAYSEAAPTQLRSDSSTPPT